MTTLTKATLDDITSRMGDGDTLVLLVATHKTNGFPEAEHVVHAKIRSADGSWASPDWEF